MQNNGRLLCCLQMETKSQRDLCWTIKSLQAINFLTEYIWCRDFLLHFSNLKNWSIFFRWFSQSWENIFSHSWKNIFSKRELSLSIYRMCSSKQSKPKNFYRETNFRNEIKLMQLVQLPKIIMENCMRSKNSWERESIEKKNRKKRSIDWFYFELADTMVKKNAHVLYFEYLYLRSIRFVAIPMS